MYFFCVCVADAIHAEGRCHLSMASHGALMRENTHCNPLRLEAVRVSRFMTQSSGCNHSTSHSSNDGKAGLLHCHYADVIEFITNIPKS